ncbi:hypothetical protein C2G38_2222732 [Gigaspora rosea]|uniref:Uncharacterized protein n=1 Tax=Gigaspora rosea TaxID=44941 RepID=A0A397U6C3_9GLOM|nr:hypothetical protein C2G38_2222732 [Gigaspora rosea]
MASHGELQFMFLGLFMNSDIQLEGNDCNCLLEILNELMTENLESDRKHLISFKMPTRCDDDNNKCANSRWNTGHLREFSLYIADTRMISEVFSKDINLVVKAAIEAFYNIDIHITQEF